VTENTRQETVWDMTADHGSVRISVEIRPGVRWNSTFAPEEMRVLIAGLERITASAESQMPKVDIGPQRIGNKTVGDITPLWAKRAKQYTSAFGVAVLVVCVLNAILDVLRALFAP